MFWKCENNQGVSLFEAEYRISASGNGDVLHAIDFETDRRRIHSRSTLKLPEKFSRFRVKGIEIAVSLAHEDEASSRDQDSADQGLLRFVLPTNSAAFASRYRTQCSQNRAPLGFERAAT
jgi:hypothetical protein